MPTPGYFTVADALATNEDGTPNDADHPAARGSTITLWGTGFGQIEGGLTAGSVAPSNAIRPTMPVYVWGGLQDSRVSSTTIGDLRLPVSTIPGVLSAIFQVRVTVPRTTRADGQGERMTVAILPFLPGPGGGGGHPPYNVTVPANYTAVYVK
jgi:uncharacterized protein (TIGR03437 family)